MVAHNLPPIDARFVHQSSLDAARNLTVVEGGKPATMAIGANEGTADQLAGTGAHAGTTGSAENGPDSQRSQKRIDHDGIVKHRDVESITIAPAVGKAQQTQEIRSLLAEAPITLSRKPRDKSDGDSIIMSAYLEGADGIVPVVIRYGHRPFEKIAYAFHKLTDFTCAIPETVHRAVTNWGPNPHLSAEGIDVQQRIGKSLSDRVAGARKLTIDPQLRDQLEQATAERLIMGDVDGYPRNMTVSRKDDQWLVANIDFAPKGDIDLRTFSKSGLPPVAGSYLRGQSISQPTLDKIRNLIERLDNPSGKKSLSKIGLSEEQSDALITRARFLLEYKRFFLNRQEEMASAPLSHTLQAKLAEDEDADVRRSLARNHTIVPELQVKLAEDEDAYVRGSLASNPAIVPELQVKLAKDWAFDVRRCLASNPAIVPELQVKLAKDKNVAVRSALASNQAIAPELQVKLAEDEDAYVRRSLANNPVIVRKLQVKLAEDANVDVRSCLASNQAIDRELQVKLAKDKNVFVRSCLASNQAIVPELQVKLAEDEDAYVRRSLASNPAIDRELQVKLAEDEDADVRRSLARNPAIVPELQVKLAEDENVYVRNCLASNPAIVPGVQVKLAEDEDASVRESLANNPAIVPGVQAKLAEDEDAYVRRALASNPAIVPELQVKLTEDEDVTVRSVLVRIPGQDGRQFRTKMGDDSGAIWATFDRTQRISA